ncbi:MAG: class I adenylate-forming enzyme family protein [Polyangia bacterium]
MNSRGTAKALVYRDTYLSWRGLHHRVERRAQEFAAMGIEAGHWVGLMLGNVPDFAILALAISKLGATVVPLDPTTGVRDLTLFLEYAPLRALITRPRGGNELPSGQTPVQTVRTKKGVVRIEPESRRRLQGTLLTCSIYRRDDEPPAAGAEVVLLTADSSGDPKGVLRTADNLEAICQSLKESLDITEEARVLTTVPLFAGYGFDLGLLIALRYGATLYLEDEVSPKRIVKLIREQEIDLLPATPPLFAQLAKLPTARPLKTKGARFIASGSLLTKATAESFRERWGVRLLPMYHTTEAGPISVDRKGLEPETVGKPLPGVDLRMGPADDEGKAPIWVRCGGVSRHAVGPFASMLESQKAPADKKGKPDGKTDGKAAKKTAVPIGAIDAEGFLRTGDQGRVDKTGRLTLIGREDDLVKVEGKRVALGEVEGCLESYPKVRAAQARVFLDDQGAAMVVATVVCSTRCGAEEIIDHCAKNLAPYKVPRRIEFSATLPAFPDAAAAPAAGR